MPADQIRLTPQGPSSCGWQSLAILEIGAPFVHPPDGAASIQYARDPNGVLAGLGLPLLQTLNSLKELPADSGATGMTNGNVELYWSLREAYTAAYVVMGDVIERWPRAPEVIACP